MEITRQTVEWIIAQRRARNILVGYHDRAMGMQALAVYHLWTESIVSINIETNKTSILYVL